MKAVIQRYHSLSIRPISFDVDRHPMRDAGVVNSGPELVRNYKGKYKKVLILWDHHGSGWHRLSPEECMLKIQERLDIVTWKNNSGAVALVTELEEWLWHNDSSICRRLGISKSNLKFGLRNLQIKIEQL